MGRLIDADDAINIFTNRLFETLKTNLPCVTAEENQICLETCYKVAKYEIDNIPTAYDTDKVVAELEEEREYSYADFEEYVQEKSPCLDAEYDDYFHRGLERAIKLVKRGGMR